MSPENQDQNPNLPAGCNQAMSDHKRVPVRCASDDPNACDYCHSFLAMPNSTRCPLHPLGTDSEVNQYRTALYNIKKTAVVARMQQMKGHPEARTLTNELGILRLTLEELLNKCEDTYDLVTQEATISRLISNIQATLTSNVKLEERVGELLSVEQVITLMQMLFEIVRPYVPNPDDQEAIAQKINALIGGQQ